jgi:hypothetical protein
LERIVKFHVTPHAARRIAERNLSLHQMQDVVKYPDTKTPRYRGEHGGMVSVFSKTVNGVTLTVVGEVKRQQCWLITGY